jgi:hypothetical protein
MASQVQGTVWNLPNYIGQIFTATPTKTPVLSMAGGLNGAYQVDNFEFPVDQTYSHDAISQPTKTETQSLTAPTVKTWARSQDKNVAQIFHEAVGFSYAKMSIGGRISGIATAGKNPEPVNELDWQIARALELIALEVEYSIIQGTYSIATTAGTYNAMRGINAAASDASNTIAAGGASLSKPLIQSLLKTMYGYGAQFMNPVFVVNAHQKTMLSSIYGYAPTDRNIGGLNIKQIETDFGSIGVVLDPYQSTSVLTVADMSFVKIVSQPVPGKGHLFYEPLAKSGAAETGQIYGQIGLDHGPGFMHGTITGLATS